MSDDQKRVTGVLRRDRPVQRRARRGRDTRGEAVGHRGGGVVETHEVLLAQGDGEGQAPGGRDLSEEQLREGRAARSLGTRRRARPPPRRASRPSSPPRHLDRHHHAGLGTAPPPRGAARPPRGVAPGKYGRPRRSPPRPRRSLCEPVTTTTASAPRTAASPCGVEGPSPHVGHPHARPRAQALQRGDHLAWEHRAAPAVPEDLLVGVADTAIARTSGPKGSAGAPTRSLRSSTAPARAASRATARCAGVIRREGSSITRGRASSPVAELGPEDPPHRVVDRAHLEFPRSTAPGGLRK